MNESLNIECEWWGPSGEESEVMQACRAAIGISVGAHSLTRLEDTWADTIRNRMNGNAYTLARWFAGNWWRLRWEPETSGSQGDVDWRMSHSMGSAGEGFSWPGILFASDGDSIAIASRANRGPVMGAVRYLTDLSERITANEFERGVDSFLSLVLSRLHAKGCGHSELEELWGEVTNERKSPELAALRRMEAICGYDPDEAPEELIRLLLEDTYLGKYPGTSRRFAACRLLGQWLERDGDTERLIPVAEAKTAQQQFQRAFAQEFLCPYGALMNRLQSDQPTPEDIDEAADHFGVSPLLVRTTLVNNGELDRESLKWVA